jgi:hypothetical protein
MLTNDCDLDKLNNSYMMTYCSFCKNQIISNKPRLYCSRRCSGKGNCRAGLNKGIQSNRTTLKLEKFKKGLSNFCKVHGEHLDWRVHSNNNIQCKKCASEQSKKFRKNNIFKKIIRDCKSRNHVFELDENFLKELLIKQNNKCALTKIEFNEKLIPSIDRIDSNLGYLKNNVQFVLVDVNRMKSDFKLDYFLMLCKKISEVS